MTASAQRDARPGASPAVARTLRELFSAAGGDDDAEKRRARRVLHYKRDGESVIRGNVIGVVEDLGDGRIFDAERLARVPLVDLLSCIDREDHDEARYLWSLTLGTGMLPGRTFVAILDAYGDGWTVRPSFQQAWLDGWAMDAGALRATADRCGTRTIEEIHEGPDGEEVWHARERCKGVRCRYCGDRVVGDRWKHRLTCQALVDGQRDTLGERPGDPVAGWFFATFTGDWRAWCERHRLPYDHPGTRVIAQRWMARTWDRVIKRIDRRYPGTSAFRTLELHPTSGFPHLHVALRGPALQDAAQEEAWLRGHGGTWVDVVAFAEHERTRPKRNRHDHAKCPFPTLRNKLREIGVKAGWGPNFTVYPADPGSVSDLVTYLSKGPITHDGHKRLPDGDAAALVGELAKGRQRSGQLLARGVQCFGSWGGFLPPAPRRAPSKAIQRTVLGVPLEVVREIVRSVGGVVGNVAIGPDFMQPRIKGRPQPPILESSSSSLSLVDLCCSSADVLLRRDRSPAGKLGTGPPPSPPLWFD